VVFAFWRGYVKGVEWMCIQFVKCNTGVILSQSTSTWQPLCARCVLPETVQWEDATTLQYWQIQQHRVMAFACGLHKRLGEVSQVSSIDESMLMHITNELLGARSLKQQWQREQMAQKTVTVS